MKSGTGEELIRAIETVLADELYAVRALHYAPFTRWSSIGQHIPRLIT